MDIKHCEGCEDDFYNGHNSYDIKECWHRADATLKPFKLIPVDLPPPYNHIKQEKLPTCYRKKRHVKVNPDILDSKGYWK